MTESGPYTLGPGEGRVIDLGDFEVTVKASEKETGGVVSVLEDEGPPGFGPPKAHQMEIVGPPPERYV